MSQTVQLWMPAIITSLRAELKQGFAELRLEIEKRIQPLKHRVERLEEPRDLVRS